MVLVRREAAGAGSSSSSTSVKEASDESSVAGVMAAAGEDTCHDPDVDVANVLPCSVLRADGTVGATCHDPDVEVAVGATGDELPELLLLLLLELLLLLLELPLATGART